MLFADALTLDAPRHTKEGYLAVRSRASRAGVYDYLGREIDPEGKHFAADATVKVYRPEEEVFAKDSVHSFLLKPITDDHPAKPVTADSWASQAKGVNAGAIRDGEYLAFDLVLMDAALIKAVDQGKRELSNGYSCELEIADGVTDDGTAYQATQRHIRGNHIAVVKAGRAGHECRIGDAATCDSVPVDLLERLFGDGQTYRDENLRDRKNATNVARQSGEFQMPHTLIIDGLQVPNVSDEAKAAIEKLQGQARDADTAKATAEKSLTDEQAKVVERDATITAKDAKIVELEAQVADAKLTPARLQDAAREYADVCAKAKQLGVTFAEDADIDTVKKSVVDAKMGDAAKDYAADHIAIAFDALVKDAKPADPLRKTIADGVKPNSNGAADVQTARQAWLDNKETAYRGKVEA